MSKSFPSLAIVGAILLLLGIIGTVYPVITTTETKEVFRIGNLFAVQATEKTPHFIPPIVSTAALILGAVLFAMSFFRKPA
jgi:hypothetical protein